MGPTRGMCCVAHGMQPSHVRVTLERHIANTCLYAQSRNMVYLYSSQNKHPAALSVSRYTGLVHSPNNPCYRAGFMARRLASALVNPAAWAGGGDLWYDFGGKESA